MRYKAGHRVEARARMIAAAGRGFRRNGFGGIGVDGLAKEAEATSGAFYGHFPSKDAAFKEVVATGLDELHASVAALQSQHGPAWVERLIDFYLSEKRTCELGESCPMQSLSPEVVRADREVKAVYEAGMVKVVDLVAQGLTVGSLADRRKRAWALLSILSGGVTMARAVDDPELSARIAKSIRSAALQAATGAGD